MTVLPAYEWPNQIWAMLDKISNRVSGIFWTMFTRLQLRLRGVVEIGSNFRAEGHSIIYCRRRNSIRIGRGVTFVSRFRSNLVGLTNPVVIDSGQGGVIIIGDHTGLSGVVLSSRREIRIGNFVQIGGNVRIFDHDFHSTRWQDRRSGAVNSMNTKSAPVIIEDDCFIGTNVLILKGSTIGARSIVAAGAVVAGLKVPSDSLVAGNPARVVKTLAT